MKTLAFFTLAAIATFGAYLAFTMNDNIAFSFLASGAIGCYIVSGKTYLDNARAVRIIKSKAL